MRTTIDGAGRIVVPKQLRDELGFGPGQELDLSAVDGKLEVELPATEMRLEERDGDLVAVTDRHMPALTAAQVRQTLERIRR
ncbi:MAG: AbrB/MazE/SpoVT family DNA-binding domain-containing protein [Actinobacteria bacterium]|nr:MAG: AbrB/MazE/SpoVT family DNA-binding domain-containing protein [Actinomycetota bacterium]